MKPYPFALLLITSVFLAACSATTYGPDETIGGFDTGGYTENRFNANTFMVSFRANKRTDPRLVKQYILYRAALLTIQNGYDYFIVTSSNFQCFNIKTSSVYTRYLSTIPARYYPSGYTTIDYSRSHDTPKYNQSCSSNISNNGMAVFKAFNGTVPKAQPGYYDAKSVMSQIAPISLDD